MDVPTISPSQFRDSLIIDTDQGPALLRDVVEPWQESDFQAIDPALVKAAGYDSPGALSRFWIERGRGHSKTSDLAIAALYTLLVARFRISGIVAAADTDQAALLRAAVGKLIEYNPHLGQLVEVQRDRIVNKRNGSELRVISSDVASSWGHLCQLVICDETSAWKSRDLFDSLLSTAAKRADCCLICILNAGFTGEWQWPVREAIRTDPRWHFSSLDGPQASWITPDRLDEQKRLLPPAAFARLWLNEWQSGAGDALDGALIDRAVCLAGPTLEPQQGWLYVAGLDLGLKRDSSALVIVGKHVGHSEEIPGEEPILSPAQKAMIDLGIREAPLVEPTYIQHEGTGKLRLITTRLWRPTPGRQVSLEEVEQEVLALDQRYQLSAVFADVWQAARSIEALSGKGVQIVGVDPVGANLKAQASELLSVFGDSRIELYADAALCHDLRHLRVVERSYGWRCESPRDGHGHGDTASAFLLALLAGARLESFRPVTVDGPLICWP